MRVLRVRNLKTHFRTAEGLVPAVDDVSFEVESGEILALVGESGCGKSVTAQTLMGLVKCPPAIISGVIQYKDRELRNLSPAEYQQVRGAEIGMIFQEPMSSFDPLDTVGRQAAEALLAHQQLPEKAARERIIAMYRRVGIPEAERRYHEYPHQMSGGMLQRMMIALVLAGNPSLLIADEPTTALDVTIQAQVLNLMRRLQQELGMNIIFITHDLAVVAEIAHRVHVMYAGKIVEKAPVGKLFQAPRHPYTQGLLSSRVRRDGKGRELPSIKGSVPQALEFPSGCRFHPRCPRAMDRCQNQPPPPRRFGPGEEVSCWLYEEGGP